MSDTRIAFLDTLVAEFSVYAQQLKQAHWNFTGPNFIEMHSFFGEKYDESVAWVDLLAEQERKLGAFPTGTLAKYLLVSGIKEEESTNPEQLTAIILRSSMVLCSHLDKAIKGTNDDLVTQNLFIEIKASIDKTIWFLKSLCPCNSLDLQDKSIEWKASSER